MLLVRRARTPRAQSRIPLGTSPAPSRGPVGATLWCRAPPGGVPRHGSDGDPPWLWGGGPPGLRVQAGSPARKPCGAPTPRCVPSPLSPCLGPLLSPPWPHQQPQAVLLKDHTLDMSPSIPPHSSGLIGRNPRVDRRRPSTISKSRRSACELPGSQSTKGNHLLFFISSVHKNSEASLLRSEESLVKIPRDFWGLKCPPDLGELQEPRTLGKLWVTGWNRFLEPSDLVFPN